MPEALLQIFDRLGGLFDVLSKILSSYVNGIKYFKLCNIGYFYDER